MAHAFPRSLNGSAPRGWGRPPTGMSSRRETRSKTTDSDVPQIPQVSRDDPSHDLSAGRPPNHIMLSRTRAEWPQKEPRIECSQANHGCYFSQRHDAGSVTLFMVSSAESIDHSG